MLRTGSHGVIAACLREALATNLDAWQQSCAGRAKNVLVSLKDFSDDGVRLQIKRLANFLKDQTWFHMILKASESGIIAPTELARSAARDG